jgi:hypothetical protein
MKRMAAVASGHQQLDVHLFMRQGDIVLEAHGNWPWDAGK